MIRKYSGFIACVLAAGLIFTCLPSDIYAASTDEFIIDEAEIIVDSDILDEEAASFSDADIPTEESPEVIMPAGTYVTEEPDLYDPSGEGDLEPEPAHETVGGQTESQIYAGTYEVTVVWPDDAVTSRVLSYTGTDRADVADNVESVVGKDLAEAGFLESEYTITVRPNRNKNTVETVDVTNDAGEVTGEAKKMTDYYNVTVNLIQPEFTEEEGDAQILAHKTTGPAPENTLTAFRYCAVKGFRYVGADIHFTSDGVPVVLHDVTLNRTGRNSDGSVLTEYVDVETIPYSEVLKYDVGIACGSFWQGEKVGTFEEFMQLCHKLNLIPNIHIKSSLYMNKARLATLVDLAVENGMQGRVAWAADDIDYLRYIKTIDPVSGLDLIIYRWTPSAITRMKALKTDTNFVEIGIVKSAFTNERAVACAMNGVLCSASANSKEELEALDSSILSISTDVLSPAEGRVYAKNRTSGLYTTYKTPAQSTDYRLLALTDTDYMFTAQSSALGSALVLNTVRSYAELNDFRFTKLADGYYQVVNTRSMLALEVKGGSTANNAAIVLNTWDATAKQRWRVVSNSNGSITLINKATGKAIQTQKGNLTAATPFVQYTATGADAQQFWMVKEPNQVKVSYTGTYYLKNDAATSLVTGIKDNSTAAQANVCLLKKVNADTVKFRLFYSGDGYYRIMNVKTKKFLTVAGNSKTSGANVIQDTWKNIDGQRWTLTLNKKGYYTITSKLGTCLNVNGNVIAAGANINCAAKKDAAVQRWRLSAS